MIRLILVSFLLFSIVAQSQIVDSSRSKVEFTVTKMKDHIVNGTIKGMTGTIQYQAGEMVSINVCIDPSTVDTDHNYRDKELKKKKYFHVALFPSICFSSSQILRTDSGLVAIGNINMLGAEQEETFRLTEMPNGLIKGEITLDRMDYGLGGEPAFRIGHEVQITVYCYLTY